MKKKICIGIMLCVLLVLGAALANKEKTSLENPVYGGTGDGEWVGDRVYLGRYEQDNDETNQAEPILWRVLSVKGNNVLLLSEYALDVRAFNEVAEEVTWEKSTVRQWLNGEFFDTALSDDGKWKQNMVRDTIINSSNNQNYGTDGGKETVDKVFLLSWEDTYNENYGFPKAVARISEYTGEEMLYSDVSYARLCYPTLYAANQNPLITRKFESRKSEQGDKVEGFGSVYWLLRTPGQTQKYISYVSRWGKTTYSFLSPVDHTESCIRPAIWVDISDLKFEEISTEIYYCEEDNAEYCSGIYCVSGDEAYLKQAKNTLEYTSEVKKVLSNEPKVKTYEISGTAKEKIDDLCKPVFGGDENGEWAGDRVYFGNYAQDNAASEKILWRVLEVESDKLVLLSEYGLRYMEFSERQGGKWEDSSVRMWLNGEFYKEAFSEEEQQAIQTTQLENESNARYGTDSGKNTTDKVYLLSWTDCINETYGFTKGEGEKNYNPTQSNTRICYKQVENIKSMKLVDIYGKRDLYGNGIACGKENAVRWWLRTAGFQKQYVCDVDIYGDVYHHEQIKGTAKAWVRPVITVDTSKVVIEGNEGEFSVLSAK